MTEKRFTMDYEPTYRDTMYLDGDDVMTENEVLNTLNRLNDENEQLKSDYDTLQIQDDARKQYQKELMEENEELKKEVRQLKNKINTYHEGNKTLHKTLQKYWEDRYNE